MSKTTKAGGVGKLVIVESPAKAKTISKYLGDGYTVMASVGHIRDLPKSNKKALDIEKGFVPHYEVSPGKEKVVKEIKSLAKKAEEVILATDPDREGEAIAWHIKEAASLKQPKRVVFHEITKDAVQEAMQHPRKIDENLKQAQEARRVLDRIVGYDLSGLIWKKLRYGLSAGRVQSPALRILVEREREIKAFVPETYYTLAAQLKTDKKVVFTAICAEEPRDKKVAERIIAEAEKGSWFVKDVSESQAKRSPYAPFTTSTLQQAASTRLGYSPSKTMMVAQKLYEAGLITYMRTDSTTLSAIALAQAQKVIAEKFGAEHGESKQFATKSKNAQEAHEAIRPTNLGARSLGATPEQKKLYELIWTRTVSSQMKPAQLMRMKVSANIKGETIPDFAVTGSRVMYEGWLMADPASRGEETAVPAVAANDPLTLVEVTSTEKETQPPPRYSEAGLVKELEKRGIGRPSTYASIIKTIIDREYVVKEGKALRPTDTGEVVSTFLEEHFNDYISDTFTADMENELDEMAAGEREYVKTLQDFYKPFQKAIASKKDLAKINTLEEADERFKCPKCGSGMVVKLGRGGKFLSCDQFPDCTGALTIDGEEIKADEPIGTHPETQEPIFIKIGRFGPYVQLGEAKKGEKDPATGKAKKPKMASIPKEKAISDVTLADALLYLSLPRVLGAFPDTGKNITANVGRFGPYVVHDGDFRSVKKPDDIYTITLDRAIDILKQPKKFGRGRTRTKKA